MHMAQSSHVRHAWKDAPSQVEYELIIDDIHRNLEEEYRQDCYFLFLTMGQLGLRAGEVTHMTREWVDLKNKTITIPTRDPCKNGRDGGICGYCKSQARQANKRYGKPMDEALQERWTPKMEASARTIPFDWSDDVVELYRRYFYDNPAGYEYCRSSINRRFDQIAEATEVIDDKDNLYPHALRAYAGIKHARNNVGAFQLADFMGWETVEGAKPYVEFVDNEVKAAFDNAYN